MEDSMPQMPDWRRFISDHSNAKQAAFAASLIPDLRHPILGVRLPELRRLAKEMAKGDWRKVLDCELTKASLEEIMLRGFLTGYAKMEWDEHTKRVAEFVTYIDNWSVCDSCCATFTTFRKHREEGWLFLLPYLCSPKEYEQRFGVVMMLDHFLCDEYIDRVLAALSEIYPAGYYCTMAVGWALATAFSKYPDRTFAVLCQEKLLPECRQKACQKILESLRTPPEWRAAIKELKQK
ncbi:MAG: DNA alkylation repair protein [Bacteroidaceae bacterium]|nr:DNA alkylation repair protein [Bacteroidaceae bacterium]